VDITPRISGLLISASVPEGERVEVGDLLFRIDPAPFALKVAHAGAELERAIAQAELASGDYSRLSSLSENGTSSRRALEVAHAEKASRDADVAAARAAFEEANLQLSYTEVRSPIAGVADRIMIQPGNQIAGGSSNILTRIVATDDLFVTFHIDEATFTRLGVGDVSDLRVQVQVASDPHAIRYGRIDFSSSEFDRSTGTLRMRAIVDNRDGQLKPGMFVRVRLPLASESNTLLVTESAIRTAPGGRYLLVVDANGTILQKSVTLGAAKGDLRVIVDGLSPGDRVVLKGLVQPGMTVDPVLVPMPFSAPETEADAS